MASPDAQAPPVTRTTQRATPIGAVKHPPTEHWLDADAERRSNLERRAWIEAMHRAAPGTDWRQIESANGEALMARRRDSGPDQSTARL